MPEQRTVRLGSTTMVSAPGMLRWAIGDARMCSHNDHFHEDFGDEPSVEERYPSDSEPELFDPSEDFEDDFEDDEPDQFRDDVEADADALANAGWGTDEDYGDYGGPFFEE